MINENHSPPSYAGENGGKRKRQFHGMPEGKKYAGDIWQASLFTKQLGQSVLGEQQ